MNFLYNLPFVGTRVWVSDLYYSKPNRITVGKAGVQVTTRTKAYGFCFSPVPF